MVVKRVVVDVGDKNNGRILPGTLCVFSPAKSYARLLQVNRP